MLHISSAAILAVLPMHRRMRQVIRVSDRELQKVNWHSNKSFLVVRTQLIESCQVKLETEERCLLWYMKALAPYEAV